MPCRHSQALLRDSSRACVHGEAYLQVWLVPRADLPPHVELVVRQHRARLWQAGPVWVNRTVLGVVVRCGTGRSVAQKQLLTSSYLGQKVAHMAIACEYSVSVSEIRLDCFSLCKHTTGD
eukprot:7532148-Pyramimonas_sp.AAC.1